MKKRIVSLALALVMVLCFIPTGIVAEAASTTTADWPSFRGNDANNGITSVATPRDASEATLKWAVKLSTGWSDAPSPMIIAENHMYTMCGSTLKKLSLTDGSVVKSATMAAATSWGSTPPLYADGKIFCQLGGSTVQAFDANTLQPLWTYTDPISGQAQSPIVYSNGKVYVGLGYNAESVFVCIDAATGAKVWSVTDTKGFYWAGAVIVGDYVVYGTENGKLYSRNKNTGALVTELSCSDTAKIRSTVTYDNGKLYWMLNDATLCRADINSQTGAVTNLTQKTLSQGASTSTVAIHNGIIYVACGKYNAYKVMAVDANTLDVKWECAQPGYPQCSILVSDAYAGSGYVYLYFTYNKSPGELYVIKAKADGTGTPESSTLFSPSDSAQQNYCICSVITDKNGTLYYKNDSGYVFAISLTEAAKTSVDAVNAAKEKIAAIGNVTLASAQDIEAARAAYDALSAEQKQLVSNYQTLISAESELTQLKATSTANPISVFVTVSDKGNVAVMQKPVTVKDINDNGIFDVDDTLYAVHKAYYGSGASGYLSYDDPTYGLCVSKLWGDTSGAFGYWVNNESCFNLEDPVSAGDHVVAFVYSDANRYSDVYSKFDKFEYTTFENEALTLKLQRMDYSGNQPSFVDHNGAALTVYDSNGNKVNDNFTVTDNGDGTYKISFAKAGNYYVVAADNDPLIVPAVCSITVQKVAAEAGNEVPPTSDVTDIVFYTAFMVVTFACAAVLPVASKKQIAKRSK